MTTSIKKYELVKENRQGELYQIRALRTFSDVKKGDLGGFIECEDNLSHDGNCWVYDNNKIRCTKLTIIEEII